jgi:hypothetical protein
MKKCSSLSVDIFHFDGIQKYYHDFCGKIVSKLCFEKKEYSGLKRDILNQFC